MGQHLSVQRFGTDGSTTKATKLLRHWEKQACVLGLGGGKDSGRLIRLVKHAPVTTGERLNDILQEWSVRHVQNKLGNYFNNAKVLFFSGLSDFKLALGLSEYTQNLKFADPLLQLGVPKLLTSLEALELYAAGAHYVLDWTPTAVMASGPVKEWTRFVLRKALQKATVVVAAAHELDAFGIEELAGKTLITSGVNAQRQAQFRDKGVHLVIDGAPNLFGHVLGPHILDAMIMAATGKGSQDLQEDDYLEIITDLQLEPRLIYPDGFKRMNRFAFVIHPLSQEYFKVVRPIELLSQVSPPIFMNALEKAMAYAPPFVYSKVTGITSPTGVQAEGWLISVGGTSKEIMAHSPEFTYRRLLAAAELAKKLGAQIMGLGAFTKVVGDAGLTVAKRAPLPITTGNSYSASGALWAAQADRHIADMDMIVTATSGAGKKVLDIRLVKPGCVITDVARPLDLSAEEVAKRPDVLVIESGEILLPGDIQMNNIGLPKNVAYACLAETVVLALEGRFENFTLGRTIEWTKVREIYRLGLKHGMKLAAISGVNGVFTDADIEQVRQRALSARAKKEHMAGKKSTKAAQAHQTSTKTPIRSRVNKARQQ